VFLDLSDLPYAANPLFRRALVDLVDQFASQYAPEIIDVGRFCQVFLFQDEAVRSFLDKLWAIETEFVDHRLSAPRVTAYALPRDTHALTARLRQHDDMNLGRQHRLGYPRLSGNGLPPFTACPNTNIFFPGPTCRPSFGSHPSGGTMGTAGRFYTAK